MQWGWRVGGREEVREKGREEGKVDRDGTKESWGWEGSGTTSI